MASVNTDSTNAMIITAKEKDLGGFSVRRVLPYATHRMVGPFIFFDHMGPAEFGPGHGIEVRPHPHVNLATVTYLFDGRIRHQDSLGYDQLIEPGAVNWMIAGRGIVHSERTAPEDRERISRLDGIQLWVALPEEHEEMAPSFVHHPKDVLPEFNVNGVTVKLLLGRAFGKESPVAIHSDLFYAEIKIKAEQEITIPVEGRDAALYLVSGTIEANGEKITALQMVIGKSGTDFKIRAVVDAHLMVIGGTPVGERFIYWNFVSSSAKRIEEAKLEWAKGPRNESSRFKVIPNDSNEFIPLPNEPGPVKGTIL